MTITSTGVPNKEGDQQEFVNNEISTTQFNLNWFSNQIRCGIMDLKAPDQPFPGCHFIWNPTPTIPPRAIIQTASFAGAAIDNAFFQSTLDTIIEAVAKDGRWDIQPTKAAHWVAGLPASAFPIHVEVHVFDGAVEIATTGVIAEVLAAQWPIRKWGVVESPPTARNQKVGETLTIATGGTLTTASVRASKFAAPSGDVWMEVYSIVGGLPSVLLATSDTRLATSLATPNVPDLLEVFVFSGGDQIVQTLGVQYAYVLTGDWTVNFTNYIQVRARLGAIGTDKFPVTFGESRGLDNNNYISGGAILDLPTIAGSGSVAWAPPPFTVDIIYTTPDLSALIQAWVDEPSYAEGDPILLRWKPINPSQTFFRGFKTFSNPDTPGVQQVTLTIGWRKRKRLVI